MKVLLTGAAGRLGRAILREAPRLAPGVTFVGLDCVGPADFVADVGDEMALLEAVQGCNAVIHTAGLHGHNLESHTRRQFYETNVQATDALLELAIEAGARRFIFSSTCQVYGHNWDVMGVRKLGPETAVNPTTIYPLTKWLAERLCLQAHRQRGIKAACLRYCNFNDGPWERYGSELCARSVWDGDAAQANLMALLSPSLSYGEFVIGPETRLQEEDLTEGLTEPAAVLERRWPGSVPLLIAGGYEIKPHLYPLLDISAAKAQLRYAPEKTFDLLLTSLRQAA